MTAIIIIVVLICLPVVLTILIYNKFVRLRNMVEEGWSGIEVQLKRRANLIPNLVETVKGYMGHERELLSKVTIMPCWSEVDSMPRCGRCSRKKSGLSPRRWRQWQARYRQNH